MRSHRQHAPVKDIELLKKFEIPVHIILCGVNDWILLDYLMIAWKTKGSVHAIEQDITKRKLPPIINIILHKVTIMLKPRMHANDANKIFAAFASIRIFRISLSVGGNLD